ncbi:beta-ketoacyl synthase N-terminal-like domain-containing protein [Nannocystis sp. SCPEA4]|uniref:type I polyketide synthase n=1 Tax=Nannocystis sp. SCPEA4 TaxID=2996787 RepID=UPI00226E32B9|nr:beta-ketoacyl synthase N-terminal-like domain-containing protein [Nannocystis sp. SCPEA4]MCY1057572.1 beta-ketoacyl synthase N-terminal-like domain-containing protein [Nannocystis sp. SCPEA4]
MKDLLSSVSALAANLSERERTLLRAALAPPPVQIAIVGIGCRFPGGADDPHAFWRLLDRGQDAVREVPADRWDIAVYFDPDPDAPGRMLTRYGAFLDRVDLFDAGYFEVSPHEARRMDPQQRLLLEVASEALVDAGIPADRLSGAPVGVFVGGCNHDYDSLQPAPADAHTLTGGLMSVLSGRLSYSLGLRGPSLTVDTACSSSLVALHLACASLRAGESDLALAGGVNLILSPDSHIRLSRMRALAGDGRCRTFDARASGYVRGEGVGVLVLKRLDDARRDGDRIWAVVRGSAVNHDGRSSGLTAPNGLSQRDVIARALADARLGADAVDYVEAHGTGTPLGDPIEVETLRELFGGPRQRPCVVGAVKTNIGHLEAAAGIAGVIKVALALHHQRIPKNLHFEQLNPRIDPGGLQFATQSLTWPLGQHERIAGVSSFGISGTNAHVVLAEAPPRLDEPLPTSDEQLVLPLSAHTPAALADLVRRFAEFLRTTDLPLGAIVRTAAVRRSHHAHRYAVVGATHEALARALDALALPGDPDELGPGAAPRDPDTRGVDPTLAQRYVGGAPIAWERVYPGRFQPVALPRLAWQHERHWADAPAAPPPTSGHALFGDGLEVAAVPGLHLWRGVLDLAGVPWLADHRLGDLPVLPAAALLDAVLWASRARDLVPVGLQFERLVELPVARELQLVLHPDRRFELLGRDLGGSDPWQRHASGTLSESTFPKGHAHEPLSEQTFPSEHAPSGTLDLVAARARLTPVDLPGMHARIAATGLQHGPRFRSLVAAWSAPGEVLAQLRLPAGLDPARHLVHPVLLDGCLQALAAAGHGVGLPVAVERFQLAAPIPARAWCHLRTHLADDHIVADLVLRDHDGHAIGELLGLRVRRLAAATPTSTTAPTHDRDALAAIVTTATRVVLGFDPSLKIPPTQDLRDLGLDSLLALDLAAAIAREVSVPIANSFALDYPTVQAMTDALARALEVP